jgi:hypothetical protein
VKRTVLIYLLYFLLEIEMQNNLMKFDPATRDAKPYPSHANQYRAYHGKVAWLYNPWTGSQRDARDIGSDITGLLIDEI